MENKYNTYNPIRYYKKFKKEYLEFIVFVKCGLYYYSYDADARMIYYCLGKDVYSNTFKIEKFQFQKILRILHEKNMNVVLVGSKNTREYYTEKESTIKKLKKTAKSISVL